MMDILNLAGTLLGLAAILGLVLGFNWLMCQFEKLMSDDWDSR